MKNLIGRLLERRLPQYLLVYIGVAWGIRPILRYRS
jgi:hypothetical protein